MISALNSALSGMNAAQTKVNTMGHNVANISTDNFSPQKTQVAELANGGVSVSNISQDPVGSLNIEEQMIGLIEGKHAFQLNANVIRTADKMLGSLIDILV